jgi:hypothetical protein
VTASPAAILVPDSTDATLGLLRELRGAHARKRAANLAYWLYIGGLVVLIYGGWFVADILHALRHPPAAAQYTPQLLRAAPAGLCALALVLLLALLWDARWRGPVTVPRPTADWLLDTPIRRDRLLRPRYRVSAATTVLAGAAAGLVPVVLLLAAGLGGHTESHALRLAGVTVLGSGLLAGLGAGLAALVEANATARKLGAVTPAAVLAVAALSGLAVLTAVFRLPALVGSVLLWSGPWGWSVQGAVALSGGQAPLWPAALALLALATATALVAGHQAAAKVPASTLRARARTMGEMSAAVSNLDARRVTTAYRDVSGTYGRARLTIRPPLRRELVLPWRDVTALVRAPSRLAWSALLSLAAVGLGALAVRAGHAALLPLAAALTLGYLAAAGLCEAARLDGDDPRRSGQLPFRFESLAWWHAIVPCLALVLLAGVPATVLALLTGEARLLPLVAVTIAVLVGGALVNSFRGQLEAEMFQGFETPLGNSYGVTISLWYVTGPLLAVGPMIVLYSVALRTRHAGTVPEIVLAAALAWWLGSIAVRRARRLRSA